MTQGGWRIMASGSQKEETMSKENIPYKIYLHESELPTHYYNVRADMAEKPAPLLHPGTGKPLGFEEMQPFSAMS